MTTWQQSDFGDRGALDMAIGPVRGVRWWTTSGGPWVATGGTMVGMFGGAWRAGENLAECRKHWNPVQTLVTAWGQVIQSRLLAGWGDSRPPDHEAPHEACTCGFYAFWQPEVLPIGDQYPIIGVIEGYGRTIIGSRGFRSERARILGLHAPTLLSVDYYNRWAGEDPALLRRDLRVRYEVPVYESLHALLADHPPTQDYAELPTAS